VKRFSLRFWIVACLFAGALIGIYIRRVPWVRDSRELSAAEVKSMRLSDLYDAMPESPDKIRVAIHSHHTGATTVYRAPHADENPSPVEVLATIPYDGSAKLSFPVFFRDNDTLVFVRVEGERDDEFVGIVWRRIYPEWWWGHFYRPEVWLAVVCGMYLSVSIVRRLLKR